MRSGRSGGAAGNLDSDATHFFVDKAISGENNGAAKLVGSSFKIADSAACFFDEKDSGGDVPFIESKFPEGIEAA